MAILHGLAVLQCARKGWKPLYCYDNNRIQAGANFRRMGFHRSQWVNIPTYSPDFNKPIEHVFNQIKEKLRIRLYQHKGPVTATLLQQWVVDVWENEISAEGIAKDVESLKNTYLAVSTKKGESVHAPNGQSLLGTGGDWPVPHLA